MARMKNLLPASLMKKPKTLEEFQEFLESMTQEQFGKVREYVEKIPKLTYDVNYECGKCKKKNTVVLEGLQSFL